MQILIRKARIIDTGSTHHGKTRDILVVDGRIRQIAESLAPEGAFEEISIPALRVSQGWLDMRVSFRDPGLEYKEDLRSGAKAAAAGGFTAVACLPDTTPVIQSKSEVEYIISASRNLAVDIMPMGAISHNLDGKEISEMYDMHRSGAVAFSNANHGIESGTLQRALLYAKGFDGLLCVQCDERSLSKGGQMHEGFNSTLLGLKGIPAHAESIAIQKNIELLRYTGGKVHFSNVSTAAGIAQIRQAKKEGLAITCDTAIHYLAFSDEMLEEYDTNYKVFPPLRDRSHIDALFDALRDGTIDALTTDHSPEDTENKTVEFDYAAFGMIGLQTFYPLLLQHVIPVIGEEAALALVTSSPRNILKTTASAIEEGAEANLTLFSPEISWSYKKENNYSRSANSPLMGSELKGKVAGIINRQQFIKNI